MPDEERKVRDIVITTPAEAKHKKQRLPAKEITLFFAVPIWIWRFIDFMSQKSWSWNNRLWRKREVKCLRIFLMLIALSWVISFIMLMLIFQHEPGGVAQFWGTYFISCMITNSPSRRWLQPSYESVMTVSKRRLKLSEAPDILGAVIEKKIFRVFKRKIATGHNGAFPLGWTPSFGWIKYGYRTASHPPEFYPRHLVVFGAYANGQFALALNCIRAAFESLKSPVVLIFDSDAGGIDFSPLQFMQGVVIYDQQGQCERAIWHVAQIIKHRRRYLEKDAPSIVIIADMWFGAAMIGKNPDMVHIKGAIEEIIEDGNQFNVNVVAFPPAQFYHAVVDSNLKNHYDRAQFFTKQTYKTKQSTGELIEKRVESPRAATDLFLWDIDGQPYECKGLVPNLEQVLYRIKISSYADASRKLFNKFAMFDFAEHPPAPGRKVTEPKIDPKVRRYIDWKMKQRGEPHVGSPIYELSPQPNEKTADGLQ